MASVTILITGKNGQVGSALATLKPDALAVGRDTFDLSKPEALGEKLEAINPSLIINAAAYTAVDKAEDERDVAFAVNAESVEVMAQYAARKNIPMVHYSTDYVFNGSGETPWREDDETGPLGVYGESKLAGEKAIVASGCDHLILRTSWVYDAKGKNFFNTMLRLGAEREELNVVSDQTGAPSYAPHLAQHTLHLLDVASTMDGFPSGIYHFCNAGQTSWCGFALAIFEAAKQHGETLAIRSVNGIPTSDYPTPAERPLNSRMNMEKLENIFGITLPTWQDGLKACIDARARTGVEL